MASVQSEIEKLKYATLEGLDASQNALKVLREECSKSADLLISDLVNGSADVAKNAMLIHEFLMFEQEVIDLFEIDSATIVANSDSLARVEADMQTLLESFDEKMEAMDVIGVAELLRKPVPAMLLRFQTQLPVLRGLVYEFINQ